MLAALQQVFRDAVLSADDGVVRDMTATPHGAIAARIAVYRNTVQGSLAEVLAAAFPVVQRIVGAPFFDALARRFAVAAPPRLPQLSAYGDGFADFLENVLADHGPDHGLAYLSDVARVEWARGLAYFAADIPALSPQALAAVAPEDMDGMVLRLHPATHVIRSRFPVHRIWQVNQPEIVDVPAVGMAIAENVLISRDATRILLRQVGDGDAVFIATVANGAALGEAVEKAFAAEPQFNLEAALRDHLIGGTFRA